MAAALAFSLRRAALAVPCGPQFRRLAALAAATPSAAGSPSTEPPPPASASQAQALVRQLERLAAEGTDTEKLRWQRLLGALTRLRGGLTHGELMRVVSALTRNPLALEASSAAPLLDHAVERLTISLEGLGSGEAALLCRALAEGRIHAGEANDPRVQAKPFSIPVGGDGGAVASRKPVGGFAPSSSSSASESSSDAAVPGADEEDAGSAARKLFWHHLAPRALGELGEASTESGLGDAELLLALAMAWRTLPSPEVHAALRPGLTAGAEAALEHGDRWSGAAPAASTARLVGALGLLQAQAAFEPPGGGGGGSSSSAATVAPSKRLVRLLDIGQFTSADLPSLLLLDLGLRGLSLGSSRLGRDATELLEGALRESGAGAALPSEVCQSLLILYNCGRLTPEEPWACELLRLAANDVDRLQRAERRVLARLLRHLASCLRWDPGAAAAAGPQALRFQGGSAEAAICFLAQHDWFQRKSRAQVSWWRSRGGMR